MKKLLTLLLAIVAVLNLAACGGQEVQIGIVLPTQNEERWTQDKARFEALLDETDYTYEILFSDGSSTTEASNIETLISKGMEVLIITAHDSAAAETAVQSAIDEGVAVIAYDRLVDLADVDFYVTFDSIVVGEQQGQFLIDNIEAGSKDNELWLYAGGTWESNAPLFFRGAWSVLYPKIADGTFKVMNLDEANIVQKADISTAEALTMMTYFDTNWDPDDTATLATNQATTFAGDISASTGYFIAPNDFTSRAIRAAFESSYANIVITGQDADPVSIASIQDGKQSMTVLKDVRTLVANAFNIADSIMQGKALPTATHFYGESGVPAVPTEVVVVTQDNLTAEIINSGYYTQAEIDAASE